MIISSLGKKTYIVMVGTSDRKGGISSVIEIYRKSGLFDRWPVIFISAHTTGGKLRKLGEVCRALARYLFLLATGKVVLVHIHSASRASFWRKSVFVILAALWRKPVIFHLHGGEFQKFYSNELGPVGRAYVRFVLDRATRIVVLSAEWKKIISRISLNSEVTCIYNPVWTIDYSEASNFKQQNMLLFLGRIEEKKGIFDLFHVIAQLKHEFSTLKLMCGGEGDVAKALQKIDELGIQNEVELLGWVTGENKIKLLSQSTVFVLPSYNEGLPMSVLEAMAARIPVVATRVGGLPEAIENGVEGFLTDPGDVAAIGSVIKELLKDGELRKNMGLSGSKKVEEKFSAKQVVPLLEELYGELLKC